MCFSNSSATDSKRIKRLSQVSVQKRTPDNSKINCRKNAPIFDYPKSKFVPIEFNKQASVIFPDGICLIKSNLLFKSTIVEEISIPSSVREIEDYAFFGCDHLRKINFADQSELVRIGKYSFSECSTLERICFPRSLLTIDTAAFKSCKALSSVAFQEGSLTERIGASAFEDCVSLTSFTIPPRVRTISNSLFFGCISLTYFTIPATVEFVENFALYTKGKFKHIDVQSRNTVFTELSILNSQEPRYVENA